MAASVTVLGGHFPDTVSGFAVYAEKELISEMIWNNVTM
jgi:hypothetical protein